MMTSQPSFYQDPFDNAFPQCSQQAGLDSGGWALVTSGDNMGKLYMHWVRVAETLRLRPELGHCPTAIASSLRVLPWAAGPARQQPCPKEACMLLGQGNRLSRQDGPLPITANRPASSQASLLK